MPGKSLKLLRAKTAVLAAGCFFLLPSALGAAIDAARANDHKAPFVAGWSQCGGYQYTGPTECEEGFYCHRSHDSYYQCFPRVKTKVTPTAELQVILTRPPPAAPAATPSPLPPKTPTKSRVSIQS